MGFQVAFESENVFAQSAGVCSSKISSSNFLTVFNSNYGSTFLNVLVSI